MSRRIDARTWNFSACPPAEYQACYFYEYLWEIRPLREAFTNWKRAAPLAALAQCSQDNQRCWMGLARLFRDKRPMPLKQLDGGLIWLLLLFADSFPEQHWLQIDVNTRSRRLPILPVWSPVLDVSQVDEPSRQEMLTGAYRGKPLPVPMLEVGMAPIQFHTFLVNWWATRDQIKTEFLQWVDKQTAEWVAALHHKWPNPKIRRTGTNTPYQWLKFLAVRRVMQAFRGDWKKCRQEAHGQWKGGTKENPDLHQHRGYDWRRAQKRATAHVAKFRSLVTPRPRRTATTESP